MAKRGKKYTAALEKIDRHHFYEPEEALALVKENARQNSMRLWNYLYVWGLIPAMLISR